jgi:ribosome-binding protein aMBF1 (putative translation factor)
VTSTVIHESDRAAILDALGELGWSQNKLARKIRRHPSMVSKVLLGHVVSAPVRRLIANTIYRERMRRRSLP